MLGKYEYGFGQTEAMGNCTAAANNLDRQSAPARKGLARTGDEDVRIDLLRGFDNGLRCGGNTAGSLKQRLGDLPGGMQRGIGSFSCQQ